MQFVVTAFDGENMLEKRMEVRSRHLAGMEKMGAYIICAGGILDGAGRPKGSVLVLDLEDRDAVDRYLENEPYVKEHVWETVTVEPMNVVIVNGEKAGK